MRVSAVLVTRGDVNLNPVIFSLPPAWEIVVWDNSGPAVPDHAVYGRYAAIEQAQGDVIYVQDDDVVLPPESLAVLIAAHQPGHVTCNMPALWREQPFYRQHALVGFGAVFDRGLPEEAFVTFHSAWNQGVIPSPNTDVFERCCDVVFTALTPRVLVDVPYEEMPWARAPGRMYQQPDHQRERRRMLDLALRVV